MSQATIIDPNHGEVAVTTRWRRAHPHMEQFVRFVGPPKMVDCRNCGAPVKERQGTAACHYCGVVR